MTTLLVVFGAMLFIVAAMAVGVIFANKPIKGSCGGMSAVGLDGACDICGGDKEKCEKEVEEAKNAENNTAFYNAAKD